MRVIEIKIFLEWARVNLMKIAQKVREREKSVRMSIHCKKRLRRRCERGNITKQKQKSSARTAESEWDVLCNKKINNSEIYLVNNLRLCVFAPLIYFTRACLCACKLSLLGFVHIPLVEKYTNEHIGEQQREKRTKCTWDVARIIFNA